MTNPQAIARSDEIRDITQRGALMGGWSNNEALVIHRMYAADTNQAEFMAFARLCRETGLSPLNQEIHCTVYSKNDREKRKMVVITAVAGFRKIGFATGEVTQLNEAIFLDADGEWRDVWTDKSSPPVAARFGIARTGMIAPRTVTVLWSEFAKDTSTVAGKFWKNMPAWMLGKVAEAQAWRAVFPAQMNALHEAGEAGDALPPPDVMVDAIDEAPELDALPAPADEPEGSDPGTSDDVEKTEPVKAKPKAKPPKGVTPDAIVGAVEVAVTVAGVTHEQVGEVISGSEDGDVAAWVLQQMGDEQTLPAMNTAIATLCEMAAEA